MLEEQTSRNTLLEKKQRKFDGEIGSLNEELRRESDAREKVARELEEAKRNKFLLEDEVQVGGMTHDARGEGAENAKKLRAPRGVLTSSRLGLPCDKETKYIALIYGPWGFRKCIWQP